MSNQYRPFVAGLPREIRVERTTITMPGVERIDAVYLRDLFAGHVAYLRRPGSDDHGSFSSYGWVPLDAGPISSYALRIKREAVALLPDVARFLTEREPEETTT